MNFLVKSHILNIFNADTYFYQSFDMKRFITVDNYKGDNAYIIRNYNVSGMLVNEILDTKINDNAFTRKISNVISYINEKGVHKIIIEIKLSEVKPCFIKDSWSKLVHSDNRMVLKKHILIIIIYRKHML